MATPTSPAASSAKNQRSDPWSKKVLCRYYLHGLCRYGSSCHYSHDCASTTNMMCKFYQKGNCSHGDQCRYMHSIPNETLGAKHNEESACNSGTSFSLNSSRNDVDWVNAAEFVPGKQYSPRFTGTYSSVVSSGLAQENAPVSECTDKCDELCPFAINGECFNGERCTLTHGLLCDMCGLYILHPSDKSQQEKHREECITYHEEDLKESFKIAQSKSLTCGICMEVIWEKSNQNDRKFGILENCNHVFCLDCIRQWRSAKAFNNKVVKACPECRVSSSFVTPSDTWIEDKEEKLKLIKGYKVHLGKKPCKYFDQGKGKCPFGANCFYLHAYPDGSKEDRSQISTKYVTDSEGNSRTIDSSTIWDFIGEQESGEEQARNILQRLFRDDLEVFDLFYLLGQDSRSSSDDDDDDDDEGDESTAVLTAAWARAMDSWSDSENEETY